MSTDADSGAIAHLVTTEDSAIGEGPPSPTINIGGQSPTSPEDDDVPRILVTGASGYIATTLIKILLKDGRFRVRGTVRNKQRKEKIQPLLDLVPDAKYPLDLVEADLGKPETWVEAIKSCRYVFHMASPFPNPSGRQPSEEELIRPAVDGTVSVLKACAEVGGVKRVVLTSSIAAISCGQFGNPDKPADYLYSEKDWSVESNCPPYEKSKYLAERAAWDFMKKLEEDKVFELVVMNPGYVQGPFNNISAGAGSIVLCRDLMLGEYSIIPEVYFPIIDVRDVAAAHFAALEKPEAAGNRYALVAETISVKEVTTILAGEFKPQGYTKFPSIKAPKFVMWAAKFFDPTAKALYPQIGKCVKYNNEKMRGELGITPRDIRETITDTGYSLIEKGAVGKTARYLGHPSTRQPPAEKPAAETVATEEPASTEEPAATEEAVPTEPPTEN